MIPIGDDNSLRRNAPVMTYLLIFLNVVVFLMELGGGEEFILHWSFIPRRFLENPSRNWITIFTAMFMHSDVVHLTGNMLYLWIFGDNVEDAFGKGKFSIFYLLSGISATFAQLFFTPGSNIPNLGASGAIAGVLGAYIFLFPGGKVNVLVGRVVTQMSALLVIGFWFLLQFISGVSSASADPDAGGVAYMAHIGGFLAGLFLAMLFRLISSK
ncbi:Uncharacterized protein PHSC3_001825 [Chlamydiales bacterium STE3]|nr:Uncharacterized protein PHSC3_001825 [Chlamydiales bacterium STE3]